MKPFTVTILGCNSAVPAYDRYPSSQVLNIHDTLFLLDCGEATQIQIRKYDVNPSRIEAIFISHLHGDHFFGLFGLINTYHLLGRPRPLHIYGPPKLRDLIDLQLKTSETDLSYELNFHPVNPRDQSVIFENNSVEVYPIPMRHGIPCAGYVFKEKKEGRKMKGEKLKEYEVPYDYIPLLRKGEDYEDEEGRIIKNEELTTAPPIPRTFVYCGDTAYHETLIPHLRDTDLLYHETTFLKDQAEKAKRTLHSTTHDAATIARKATVKKLLIGHYSAKYRDLTPFLEETTEKFPNTVLAKEGKEILIPQQQPVQSKP